MSKVVAVLSHLLIFAVRAGISSGISLDKGYGRHGPVKQASPHAATLIFSRMIAAVSSHTYYLYIILLY